MTAPDSRTLTRRHDPETSAEAADQLDDTSRQKAAVLYLIGTYNAISDRRLCELYFAFATQMGWPIVAWDSPRKRRSELSRTKLHGEPVEPAVVWSGEYDTSGPVRLRKWTLA